MAEYIRMPQKGLTEEYALLADWYVNTGDTVEVGQPLFALETGKAAFDVESEVSGTVLDIFAKQGEEIPIKGVVMVIGEPGEEYDQEKVNASGVSSGASVDEPGARPAAGPDSGDGAAASDAAGASAAGAPAPLSAARDAPAPSTSAPPKPRGMKISPRARKLAVKEGVSIEGIKGTGPGGRIIVDDITAVIESGRAAGTGAREQQAAATTATEQVAGTGATAGRPAGAATGTSAQTAAGAATGPGPATNDLGLPTETIPVSKMRSIIAKRLSDSFFTAPHAFLRIALAVDHLFETRTRINTELKKTLSLNAFFMKLTAETLKRHPIINATWKGDAIELFKTIDIALAVALPGGLITPIVRNCGKKGVEEISDELANLIDLANKGKLLPEQINGATFTISNLGSYGLEEFTAIINPPGSAILALGEAVKEQVVMENDEVEIHKRMRVTLSCDHRVIDGATGAAFLRDLKTAVEDPLRILLTSRNRADG